MYNDKVIINFNDTALKFGALTLHIYTLMAAFRYLKLCDSSFISYSHCKYCVKRLNHITTRCKHTIVCWLNFLLFVKTKVNNNNNNNNKLK